MKMNPVQVHQAAGTGGVREADEEVVAAGGRGDWRAARVELFPLAVHFDRHGRQERSVGLVEPQLDRAARAGGGERQFDVSNSIERNVTEAQNVAVIDRADEPSAARIP